MDTNLIVYKGGYHGSAVIEFANGVTDAFCIFCGMLCTVNSSCNKRYHTIHGNWELSVHIDILSCCDKCYEKYLRDKEFTKIMFYQENNPDRSRIFIVDGCYREND